MEKICIFCGRSLGRWERKSLYCGNGTQTVCKECYEKYSPMTNVERGLLAWETGRAESREELREFVEQAERTREEKQEKEREDREQKRTGKICLRCGGEMLDLGSMKLKLGEETFFSVTGTVLPADPWTCRSSGARTAERQNFTFLSRSKGRALPHGWMNTKFLGKSCVSGCHLDKIYL